MTGCARGLRLTCPPRHLFRPARTYAAPGPGNPCKVAICLSNQPKEQRFRIGGCSGEGCANLCQHRLRVLPVQSRGYAIYFNHLQADLVTLVQLHRRCIPRTARTLGTQAAGSDCSFVCPVRNAPVAFVTRFCAVHQPTCSDDANANEQHDQSS